MNSISPNLLEASKSVRTELQFRADHAVAEKTGDPVGCDCFGCIVERMAWHSKQIRNMERAHTANGLARAIWGGGE